MERFKEILISISVIIIFALLVDRCTAKQQNNLEGESKQLKKQIETLERELDGTKVRNEFLKDSIKQETEKKDKVIAVLRQDNRKLELRIKTKKKLPKNTSYEDVAEFQNRRFNVKSASVVENSVVLKDSLPFKIMEEQINCDEDIGAYKQLVENKDKEISVVNSKLGDSNLLLVAEKNEKNVLQELADKQAEQISTKDKTIKKLKTRNTIGWITVGVAATLGFLLGGAK